LEPSPRKRGRPPKVKLEKPENDWVYPESDFEGLPDDEPKKIALVGSFPEHWAQAPFNDDSWEIWTFSAGMRGKHPRWDKWFELHPEKTYQKYENISKGYIEFIKEHAIVQGKFPAKELIEEFGPYFFSTGQITWMLAYAITQKPDTIGIWGVEAVGEYSPQRKDIHHFIQVARDRGIKIVIPENSTLLAKPKLYAFASLGT
jgi:hypothetical protein